MNERPSDGPNSLMRPILTAAKAKRLNVECLILKIFATFCLIADRINKGPPYLIGGGEQHDVSKTRLDEGELGRCQNDGEMTNDRHETMRLKGVAFFCGATIDLCLTWTSP